MTLPSRPRRSADRPAATSRHGVDASSDHVEFPKWGRWLYERLGPGAHLVRTALQMAIGTIVTGLLVLKALKAVNWAPEWPSLDVVLVQKPLAIVGEALTFSAGFELAYMLFTPGPDEAIEPVILGLASAVLLVVSDETVDWRDAVVAPLLCAAIGLLFYIDKRFLQGRGRPEA